MPSATNKIALFIDGANLYATAKTLGFDIEVALGYADHFLYVGRRTGGSIADLPPNLALERTV